MAWMPTCSTWMPHVYSIFAMIVLPVGLLFAVPMPVVDQTYLGSSICYVFVSVLTLVQTFAAWRFGRNRRDPRSTAPPGESTGLLRSGASEESTKLAYLIPVYLNNEANILDDTLASYCDVKYRGSVLVLVVFNSTGDLGETEGALIEKWDGLVSGQSENIRVSVVKNYESTSKAENVNHGLSLIPLDVEYIAIMDADHQPLSTNASIATNEMRTEGYDVLQGACTIRNQDNFLSKMVSVEFEHMYSVAHQGRFEVFNLGLFVGSNGYWKSSVLKEIEMDKSMLTEDIDSSMRAILAGYKIGQTSNVISSELSPLYRSVLQEQRLRWAQGWAEVSFKHAWNCIVSSKLSIRQKLGIVYLLGWREVFVYITFWPLWCVIVHAVRTGKLEFGLMWDVIGGVVLVFGFARVVAAYALCKGSIGSNKKAFLMFAFWGILYDIYLNHIQVCGHGRSLLKDNAWIATTRE
eukprot:g11246.t1